MRAVDGCSQHFFAVRAIIEILDVVSLDEPSDVEFQE